jgi:hypothetical protein
MSDERHNPEGGEGGPRRTGTRGHLRILEAAVYQGWDIPEEAFATIPIDLLSIAQDEQAATRDRIRASEALAHLTQQRIDAAIQLDRIIRLDAGQATDRVQIMDSLSEAQLQAVAASLRPAAPTKPTKPCRKPKPR